MSASRQVSPNEMLAALADPACDPTAKVLLEVESLAPSPIRHSLILQDAPNRVTIRAVLDAPGYLVRSDTWYPGWRLAVLRRVAYRYQRILLLVWALRRSRRVLIYSLFWLAMLVNESVLPI